MINKLSQRDVHFMKYHVVRPSRNNHFYVEVPSKAGSRLNIRASAVLEQAAVWRSILSSRGVLLSPWQVIIWCLLTWWLMPSRVTSDWTWDVRLITESLRYKLRFCKPGGSNESHLSCRLGHRSIQTMSHVKFASSRVN